MPATASGGIISRITTTLQKGQAVTSSRHDVDHIVTEFGMVRLKGLTVKQRSDALISIAAPRFRDSLQSECKKLYGW